MVALVTSTVNTDRLRSRALPGTRLRGLRLSFVVFKLYPVWIERVGAISTRVAWIAAIETKGVFLTMLMLFVRETWLRTFCLVAILPRAPLRASLLLSRWAVWVVVVLLRLFCVLVWLTGLLFLFLNLLSKFIIVEGLL